MSEKKLCFEQVHIDVARNSTDDFNPFHDPQRWQRIKDNPFTSPIALGFQLEFLAADRIAANRRLSGHDRLVADHQLHYSNYEFMFTGALHAGEAFAVEIKKTVDKTGSDGSLSTRAVLRKGDGSLVLMGNQSETRQPRFLADAVLHGLPSLEHLPDRIIAPGTRYFLKRKFLNTSNGKNFALAALCDQRDYFDELDERIDFPPLFTAALLSSALLERGWAAGYDFEADPLVYTRHQISVDNRLQRQLRSNDRLHILVEGPLAPPSQKGLGGSTVEQQLYRCFGLLHGQQILFRANVQLAPLHGFLS